jgi:hypothetical protein
MSEVGVTISAALYYMQKTFSRYLFEAQGPNGTTNRCFVTFVFLNIGKIVLYTRISVNSIAIIIVLYEVNDLFYVFRNKMKKCSLIIVEKYINNFVLSVL